MFEPISKKEYLKALEGNIPDRLVDYENIIIPIRSTYNSAGYDIYSPYKDPFRMEPGQTYIIPTLLKADLYDADMPMELPNPMNTREAAYGSNWHFDANFDNKFLALYPRSSFGFKYGFQLLNTTGIIDADYYNNSDNEGHIMVGCKVEKECVINPGDKFCQAILQPFLSFKYEDRSKMNQRSGGMGSTGA